MLTRRVLWMGVLILAAAASPGWAKSVTLATQEAGPVGSDVVVRVSVDADLEPFQSLDATFTFDDARLEFKGAFKNALTETDYTLLTNVIPDPLPDDAPDSVDISLFSGTPLALADGDHEVLWLLFRVLDDSASTPLVLDASATEVNEDPGTAEVDGAVDPGNADAAFIVPDDASGAPTTVVEVPVIVDPADGLQSFDITLEFNPFVITAVSVSTTPATAAFTVTTNLLTPGKVLISLFDDNPVVGSGALEVARISFNVVGDFGDETPLDLTVGITDDGVTTYLDDGFFRICPDADGDGVTACPTDPADCDDTDDTVYPGAPQLCDGLDNDCGPGWPVVPATETDDDGDDYVECEPWVGAPGTFGGDCDDTDDTVYPGAPEDCDAFDDDCDGNLNNGAADASCDEPNTCTDQTCNMAGMCVFTASGTCDLSGTVIYYRDFPDGDEPSNPAKPVPDVTVALSGSVVDSTTTDSAGDYLFSGVFGAVTVTPSRVDTVNDTAVGATDASRIAQSTVGIGLPLTAHQIIAADVSDNGTISSFDAALVAQYSVLTRVPFGVVGLHFPAASANMGDWEFVPASQAFPMVAGDVTDVDFVAILYGDVTGNWTPPPLSSAASVSSVGSSSATPHLGRDVALTPNADPSPGAPSTLMIAAESRLYVSAATAVPASHAFRVTLGLAGADGILGMDMVIDAQRSGLRVLEARPVGLASGHQLVSNDDAGRFRMALVGAEPLAGSGDFLELLIQGPAGAQRKLLRALTAEANEGQIPIVIDDGQPRVIGPQPLQGLRGAR